MKAYERLIQYAKINTVSSDTGDAAPSTPIQFDLARVLCEELRALGVEDAAVSQHCYVTGHIPAAPGHENAPCLGLIAHMDTAPDFSGENVHPLIHENYDGGDLPLGSSGRTLSVKMFPHLASLKGRTLIINDFREAFSRVDAIVTPVTVSSAFRLGEKMSDPLDMYLSDILTISANLAAIPGLSIPAGKDVNGMPVGLQIMGSHFQEKKILNIARALELSGETIMPVM